MIGCWQRTVGFWDMATNASNLMSVYTTLEIKSNNFWLEHNIWPEAYGDQQSYCNDLNSDQRATSDMRMP